MPSPFSTLLKQGRARLLPSTLVLRQAALVVMPFGIAQALRLGTNIILTRLLAPEIFGLMLLLNSLRTGAELLSDVGIGQSVVRSTSGDEDDFLDVAWTLQFLRGLLLAAVALAAAFPLAQLYGKPELTLLIAAMSPVFILTGLQSPGLFLAQRRMELGRRAWYDIANTVQICAVGIVLALVIKSVWALVIALVVSTFLGTLLTFWLFERRWPRFRLDHAHAREIIGFGKWIFLATAIFFAATSFDRFYFVGVLPIALAGVYGVARTFSDLLSALSTRAGAFLVFPRVAAMREDDAEAAPRLRAVRRRTLAIVALATGVAVAGSDAFILFAYDQRYHAAAFMIPILMVGVWFGIMSSFADSMLMGAGRPAPGALANAAKFAVMALGLPLAIGQGSMVLALLVLVASEIARWLALVPPSLARRFARPLDDLALTVLMLVTAVGTKWLLGMTGLVPTIAEWWAMHARIAV